MISWRLFFSAGLCYR